MTVTVLHGDCLDVLPTLAAASIDAVVTDPPYHLTSIANRFGGENAAPAQFETDGAYARASRGFMGQTWDGGDIAFRVETWAAVLRALKPGAHMLAFSGTRTYHRMVCAIEDAGFEIRDQVGWLYASGFPKSHDISKAIDRMAGAEREVVGQYGQGLRAAGSGLEGWRREAHATDKGITAPATDAARQWHGWGTALKPAWEPIVLARKPLAERTISAQVLATGTGGLNIDACRIATSEDLGEQPASRGPNRILGKLDYNTDGVWRQHTAGRWPANVCHDGSDEVLAEFAKYGESKTPTSVTRGSVGRQDDVPCFGDVGTAARFFFSAKADSGDRLSSKHPTVKPVNLMRWLVRMVTPPGGTVLDPFAGSGTTSMACMAEGFDCVLVEREAQYVKDIEARLKHVRGADTPLFAEPDAQMVMF